MRVAWLVLVVSACGGQPPSEETPAEPAAQEPRRPEAEPPRQPAEPPALRSGAFAFTPTPPRSATIRDDERGSYALVVGLGGDPAAAARTRAGELSGRAADDLARGVRAADRALRRLAEAGSDARAAFASLAFDGATARVVRGGDVRVWRLRGGTLEEWNEGEAPPLGEGEAPVARHDVRPGDVVVLSAPGVHHYLDEIAMVRVLATGDDDPEAMARRLVQESADHTSERTHAAVVVRVE
ncbi:MAG TPA: hypothetical protein RMH99_27215 [Sandaracinaceae bacterium LLY-WYZ-13_1]|nr:hypothetical protein [Sandaracinaceae bacterium LLY-WYZ-13_1]